MALFAVLMNLQTVLAALRTIGRTVYPVFLGFFLAFILNVPMHGFEKLLSRLARRRKKPLKEKCVRFCSLLLTLLCLAIVVALVCTLVIPSFVESITSLYNLVVERWPAWSAVLREYNIDTAEITRSFEKLDAGKLMELLTGEAGTILSSAVNFVSDAVSGVVAFGIAFVIAIYALMCKLDLARQADKLMRAHLSPTVHAYLTHVGALLSETYSRFLSGHCVEACILGILETVALGVFRVPYASLIGMLTAILAFVPYVGAITSCVVGGFLVLLVDPSKLLVCIIVYTAVQQIENQFIYPHVVGAAVDLPPLWTLIAVFIGGKLMGLLGMIFFIPLFAIAMILIRENTNRTLARREAAQCADDEPQCTDEPQGDGKDGQ